MEVCELLDDTEGTLVNLGDWLEAVFYPALQIGTHICLDDSVRGDAFLLLVDSRRLVKNVPAKCATPVQTWLENHASSISVLRKAAPSQPLEVLHYDNGAYIFLSSEISMKHTVVADMCISSHMLHAYLWRLCYSLCVFLSDMAAYKAFFGIWKLQECSNTLQHWCPARREEACSEGHLFVSNTTLNGKMQATCMNHAIFELSL